MLIDSALFLLIGIALAGVIRTFLSASTIEKLVGGGRFSSIFKSALIGIPLPLCSCSVLPVAEQLRRSGMKRGPLSAFLVSTPETGVDSIMLTYALLDPVLTVVRPLAAFGTALVSGLVQSETKGGVKPEKPASNEQSCGCSDDDKTVVPKGGLISRLRSGLHYSFSEMIADLAPYLLIGYVAAGLVDSFVGQDIANASEIWRSGIAGYAGAILIGVPLYICATSSTPLAAVLLGSGISPGAVLVFLLVGPATNLASMVVLKRILGFAGTIKYLVTVVAVAILFGFSTDWFYDYAVGAVPAVVDHRGSSESLVSLFSAIIISLLITYWSVRRFSNWFRRVFA